MNEPSVRLPRDLRETIGRDLRPVRPLRPPWRRLAYASPLLAMALLLPFLHFGPRDVGGFGLLMGWVPVAIQTLLALSLLLFALQEGIPGWRAPAPVVFAACIGAYAVQVIANLVIFLGAPAVAPPPSIDMAFQCFRIESLIALPILVAAAWLVARSLPQRPLLAGFLAGTGAGFAGDASWRLICPASDPAHVLLGHTLGIAVLGLTGLLLGYLWSLYASSRTR